MCAGSLSATLSSSKGAGEARFLFDKDKKHTGAHAHTSAPPWRHQSPKLKKPTLKTASEDSQHAAKNYTGVTQQRQSEGEMQPSSLALAPIHFFSCSSSVAADYCDRKLN